MSGNIMSRNDGIGANSAASRTRESVAGAASSQPSYRKAIADQLGSVASSSTTSTRTGARRRREVGGCPGQFRSRRCIDAGSDHDTNDQRRSVRAMTCGCAFESVATRA